MSKQGTDSDISKQYHYSICIERDQTYYIEYSDSGNNGWDRKSYVQIMNGNHTIYKGSLGKGSSSGSDTFIYQSCQSNEVEATLTRDYGYMFSEESFKIYKGTSSSGTLIIHKQGSDSYKQKQYTYSICMEPNQSYYIEYYHTGNYG